MLLELYQAGSVRTPQVIWTLGYLSGFLGLFFVFLEGVHRNWRFKFLYLATGLHYLFVSAWAASFIVGDGLNRELSDLIISITTAGMIFGVTFAMWQWLKGRGVL